MNLLIRVNAKAKNYQGLAGSLAATEPPYWMAVRAAYLSQFAPVEMIDTQVEELDIDKVKRTNQIEWFTSGNHPSAYIQETDGINTEVDVHHKIWKTIPDIDLDNSPRWDLLDMSKYKAHNWHVWNDSKRQRSPYGVVCSSYGCPYSCNFCNVRQFYGKYVERDLSLVVSEIKTLAEKYHVKNIKFLDEMFLFKPERISELCDMIIDLKLDLNIWVYARMDTVDIRLLPKLKKAGFNWICVGIESGNEQIRKINGKGTLTNQQIKEIITEMKGNGVNPLGNYIFGFPEDNLDTMQQTLDFAKELNCEFTNFYSMVDYSNITPPYTKYAQYSYDCEPISTEHLSSADILRFRDKAFYDYYSEDKYLTMMSETFGWSVVREIEEMTNIKLKRKLLESG